MQDIVTFKKQKQIKRFKKTECVEEHACYKIYICKKKKKRHMFLLIGAA